MNYNAITKQCNMIVKKILSTPFSTPFKPPAYPLSLKGDIPLLTVQKKRPTQKLLENGAKSLTDIELISIILGGESKNKNIRALAESVLELVDTKTDAPSVKELAKIKGLGSAKSSRLAAALELGRRRWGLRGIKIKVPADVFSLIRQYAQVKQEQIIGISLNAAHEVIAVRVVTLGLVNKTCAHPREVFADMVADRAVAAIIAHNHPSGNLKPSAQDNILTHRMYKAGKILGIRMLDHIIFTTNAYYSYKEAGRANVTLPYK